MVVAKKRPTRKAAEPTSRDIRDALVAAKPKTCGAVFTALTTAFGETVAAKFASEGCRRLPRHSNEHKAEKPRGLMTPSERAAASARRIAAKQKVAATKIAKKDGPSRLVTVGDKRFRVFADGTTRLIEPKVRVIPAAVEPRRVAAPAKRVKTTRSRASGQPRLAQGHLRLT